MVYGGIARFLSHHLQASDRQGFHFELKSCSHRCPEPILICINCSAIQFIAGQPQPTGERNPKPSEPSLGSNADETMVHGDGFELHLSRNEDLSQGSFTGGEATCEIVNRDTPNISGQAQNTTFQQPLFAA